jgi:hypothetical protein
MPIICRIAWHILNIHQPKVQAKPVGAPEKTVRGYMPSRLYSITHQLVFSIRPMDTQTSDPESVL